MSLAGLNRSGLKSYVPQADRTLKASDGEQKRLLHRSGTGTFGRQLRA
jgi:hypothetical protein